MIRHVITDARALRCRAFHMGRLTMNKMRVKCIRCNREWEKEASICWGADQYSSSLCDKCFVEVASAVIKRKQRREGNFDCFGTAGSYCDQDGCKYRRWCLRMESANEYRSQTEGAAGKDAASRAALNSDAGLDQAHQ